MVMKDCMVVVIAVAMKDYIADMDYIVGNFVDNLVDIVDMEDNFDKVDYYTYLEEHFDMDMVDS